jgi:hypothetical protein
MGSFPISDVSRPGRGSGHIQVTVGGNPGLVHLLFWPRHHAVGMMTLNLSFMWAQAGDNNDRNSILYLKCPLHLKLKSQFSRLWHKLKDKRAALLSSTDSIRHLDFFHYAPYLNFNSWGANSFYLFHAYYHQFQWRCNPFYLMLCPFCSLSYKF